MEPDATRAARHLDRLARPHARRAQEPSTGGRCRGPAGVRPGAAATLGRLAEGGHGLTILKVELAGDGQDVWDGASFGRALRWDIAFIGAYVVCGMVAARALMPFDRVRLLRTKGPTLVMILILAAGRSDLSKTSAWRWDPPGATQRAQPGSTSWPRASPSPSSSSSSPCCWRWSPSSSRRSWPALRAGLALQRDVRGIRGHEGRQPGDGRGGDGEPEVRSQGRYLPLRRWRAGRLADPGLSPGAGKGDARDLGWHAGLVEGPGQAGDRRVRRGLHGGRVAARARVRPDAWRAGDDGKASPEESHLLSNLGYLTSTWSRGHRGELGAPTPRPRTRSSTIACAAARRCGPRSSSGSWRTFWSSSRPCACSS